MKSLALQLLASIIVFVSLSFSQDDGNKDGRRYVVEKQINIREFIRFNGKRGVAEGDMANFDHPENNGLHESSSFSLSPLLTKVHNAASLNKIKDVKLLGKSNNNTGSAIVCGPKGAHLNVSWEPKVINPKTSVRIYLDIINPINFNKGQVHMDFYMEGNPGPIFSLDQDVACTDISSIAPFITCPLKKGERHTISFPYSDMNRVPEGSYTIVTKIFSYEGNPHPLYACLNMTLKIIPS